jgi:archaemetzincin
VIQAIHLQRVGRSGVSPTGSGEQAENEWVGLLDELAAALAPVFRISCHVRTEAVEAASAFDPVRNQYYSTAILQLLARDNDAEGMRVLAVTSLDLYVPVLTFVFGEAQLGGGCAVVSLHRLREEFYGLPANGKLLRERLLKEALHELGHTFGLRHCADWRCVMASAHAVERLDIKSAKFCPACRAAIDRALAGNLSSLSVDALPAGEGTVRRSPG